MNSNCRALSLILLPSTRRFSTSSSISSWSFVALLWLFSQISLLFSFLLIFSMANECLGICYKYYVMILIFYFNDLQHFNDLKHFNFWKYLHYFKEGAVQETANTTGLTAILRKACLHGWLLAGIWEPVFPPIPAGHKWLTVPKLSVEMIWFCWMSSFLMGVWNFGMCQAEAA